MLFCYFLLFLDDTLPSSLIYSNLNLKWKQRKNKELVLRLERHAGALGWTRNNDKHFVATLTLGSWPRQKVARLRVKRKTRECKECEGMNLHTPKWTPMFGVRVPNGLANLQSAIARVKTHRLEKFFIILESHWSVDV